MKDLSERQRTVFLLRYVEEQELSEIARATGLSEGTVKAHLSRALAKVRAELGGKAMSFKRILESIWNSRTSRHNSRRGKWN